MLAESISLPRFTPNQQLFGTSYCLSTLCIAVTLFSDPVLTDRAFLAKPKTMLLSFLTGGALSATFILLFSFVGIYGRMVAVLEPDT